MTVRPYSAYSRVARTFINPSSRIVSTATHSSVFLTTPIIGLHLMPPTTRYTNQAAEDLLRNIQHTLFQVDWLKVFSGVTRTSYIDHGMIFSCCESCTWGASLVGRRESRYGLEYATLVLLKCRTVNVFLDTLRLVGLSNPGTTGFTLVQDTIGTIYHSNGTISGR